MADIELSVNQLINSGTEVADTYVVPDGKKALVYFFEASSPDSSLATSRIVWDYGGAESNAWVIQRHGRMPNEEKVLEFVGDGVKKLALVCDNGCSSNYYFNGFAKVKVK